MESVVSTLTVLFGSTSDILACLTPLAAASLLVFCLLYTPCVAAIASIKRELGSGNWIRTSDKPGMNRILYQLSYAAVLPSLLRGQALL